MRKSLLTLLMLPGLASAHAVLDQTTAESGSYYQGEMRIGHGCDGSDTVKVTIDIPEGFYGAKPKPKAGWQIDIVKADLEDPYESHGKWVHRDVRQITWYGNALSHAHFDEFEFTGQIGVGNTEKLYFPVRQECVVGELNWNQTPDNPQGAEHDHHQHHQMDEADGHAGHGKPRLDYPAPVINVVDGTGGHHH